MHDPGHAVEPPSPFGGGVAGPGDSQVRDGPPHGLSRAVIAAEPDCLSTAISGVAGDLHTRPVTAPIGGGRAGEWVVDPVKTRHRTLLVVAALALGMVSPLATNARAGTPGAGDTAADGRRLYLEHCAACHGPTGRGDGPNAALFSSTPRNLQDGVLARYSTDDLVHRVRDGRPLELALELPALQARSRDAEAIVAHMKRLPTVDWGPIDEGWGIYMQRCESCHGRFGRPPASFPPGVRRPQALGEPAFQTSVTDADLIGAVRHGRKGMQAPKPQLTADEADLVARFIRFLSPGFELYSQYCAACHGDDGRGAPSLDPAVPTVQFDAAYFAQQHPEELRKSVWHMMDAHQPSMPHLRTTLTESQVRSILEYLRSTGGSPGSGPAAPGKSP